MKKIKPIATIGFSLIATTLAIASDWDALGDHPQPIEDGCPSYLKGCVESIKTRYGEFILKTKEDHNLALSIHDKEIISLGGYSIFVQEKFQIGKKDLYLVVINTGGSGCPMDLYILEISDASSYKFSERFGTCNDYYKANVINDSLIVRMPPYFDEIYMDHLNKLSKAERRKIKKIKETVYTWSNSKLTEKNI